MFRKSLYGFLTLILFGAATIVSAQQAPNQKGNTPIPTVPPPVPRDLTVFFSGERAGYLGVQMQEVSKENFSKFGLSAVRGVAIEKVLENSPAAQSGLQAGDVIIRFNGEEITSVKKLTRLISEVAPDHQVALTVSRGGSERQVNVTIGKRPVPTFENGSFRMTVPPHLPQMENIPQIKELPLLKEGEKPNVFTWRSGANANRQIGVGVAVLTEQLGEYFGVPGGKGLLINNVSKNSPAEKAGLKAGDVIVEVEGREIKGNIDLIRAISEKKEGEAVTLTIIRSRNRQTIQVTPEAGKNFPLENFVLPGEFPLKPAQVLIPSRVL